MKLSISETCSKAWNLLTSHLVLIIFTLVILAVTYAISFLFGGNYNISPDADPAALAKHSLEIIGSAALGSVLTIVVSTVVKTGYYKLLLNTYDGMKPAWSAWKMPLDRYVTYFFVELCSGLAVLCAACFFLIPGIWVACRLLFAPMIVLDDPECGFSDAFSRSWNMTRGYSWTLFGLGIVAYLFVFLGFCCFVVGIFFAVPLIYLMQTVAFRTLQGTDKAADEPAPTFETIEPTETFGGNC